jgi:hypothetical protein
LGEFQAKMVAQYPASYGGLFENSDGTFTVVEVGSDPTFESTAQSLFNQLPAQYGATVSSDKLQLQFQLGSRSLNDLYLIKNQIANLETATAQPSGAPLGAYGTALDIRNSQVVVTADTASPANITPSQLASRFGSAARIEVEPAPQLQDRIDDTPPWNSGDEIITGTGSSEVGCTLGWGVHNTSNGNHFSLSAGHCGKHTWYNTRLFDPVENSSTEVGSTIKASTQGLDTQLIPDSSSILMWAGPTGQGTRVTITGYSNPAQGSYVCREGAFAGEQCGTVAAVDQSFTIGGENLQNLIVTNGLPGTGGDSGGPLLFPSIFGPLAGGTIVGVQNGNGVYEEIEALLYVWSNYEGAAVVVNTNSSP